MRKLVFMLVISFLLGSIAIADTYAEKVKTVDAKENTLSIVIDKKEKSFPVDPKAQILSQVKAGKRLNVTPLKDGLKAIKAGDDVILTTELKQGEEVITKVVRSAPGPAPKKAPDAKKE